MPIQRALVGFFLGSPYQSNSNTTIEIRVLSRIKAHHLVPFVDFIRR